MEKAIAAILIGMLLGPQAYAREAMQMVELPRTTTQNFLGMFTTDTVPLPNCKIVKAEQRMAVGHMLSNRAEAHAALDEALGDFPKDAEADGYNAIIGFRPEISSSVTGNTSFVLVSWVITGVAVKVVCK